MIQVDSITSPLQLKSHILSDSLLTECDSLLQHLSKGQGDISSVIYIPEGSRIIELMSNDLFWALVGGTIGIIFSFLVWLGKWVIESCIYKRRYGKYSDYYISRIASDENDPHYVLKLKQKRNEFEIKGVSIKKNENGKLEKRNENITGHITMSNTSKNFGIGQYQHTPDAKNKIRSGEYRIQLTPSPDNRIIAIQNIIDNNLHQSIPKYIWEPLDSKKDNDYLKIYKSLIK
uniref:Uncharacterized protein n=1 Tax=Tenacibaculum sp. Pbs-1 TaxID=3238748 RepID=A0AB33L3X5_9FLAO